MSLYNLVPREYWNAWAHPTGLPQLRIPVEAVFFSHTTKDYSSQHAKESPGPRPNSRQIYQELQYLLRGDTERRKDIRFNFMIAGDGNIYEGRGWKHRPFLPSKYVEQRPFFNGIYITFIGDFKSEPPSDMLFQMREEFIRNAVDKGYVKSRFSFISMISPWNTSPSILRF